MGSTRKASEACFRLQRRLSLLVVRYYTFYLFIAQFMNIAVAIFSEKVV